MKIWALSLGMVVAACSAAIWLAAAPPDEPLSGFSRTQSVTLFPRLQARLDQLASVEIETPRQLLEFRREGDEWHSRYHQGYPVHPSAVESMAQNLAALRADYLSNHVSGTEHTSGPGRPVIVRLFAPEKEILAAAMVGHEITVPDDGVHARVLLRREHEQREWLAYPAFRVETDPGAWLNRGLLNVPREHVARLVSIAADGAQIVLERSEREGLRVAQGTAGSDLAGDPRLEVAAAALEQLQFDEALPAGRIRRAAKRGRTLVTTNDGLIYTINWLSDAGRIWATLSADRSPSHAEERTSAAEKFNDRHAPWAYRLPLLVQEQLMIRADDLRRLEQSSETNSLPDARK
jgi:hypothetical protein